MIADIVEVIGYICLLAGCSLTLIAALALVKFPDLLARQHAATKPQVLGLILMMLGAVFVVQDSSLAWTALLVIMFQMVTSPISAHMLSRAGYRTGQVKSEYLVVDELAEDLHDPSDFRGPGRAESDRTP